MRSGVRSLSGTGSFIAVCALLSALIVGSEGSSRSLTADGSLPVLTAPAPGPGSSGPPCTCSIASIFSGVTYCFALSDIPGSPNVKSASPNCRLFPQGYTYSGRIVTLAPGIKTSAYPNATISGQGLQCNLTSFNGPVPAPTAPPASAGAEPCIGLPAGDYGPTATISYGRVNNTPTSDCSVPSGTVCSINIPISNGTAKLCASQSAEDQLRG